MLIVVDCGNTNTVVGVYEGEAPNGDFRHIYRFETDSEIDASSHRERFDKESAAAGLAGAELDGAAIASVVPAALPALRCFAKETTGSDPVVIGSPGVELGMEVLVDAPCEVGADRLVNAVAAHALYPGPLIIVDFGTATTFDVVSADGDYAGGVIAPGINLALSALHEAAALLPPIDVARPAHVIGRDTVAAMQSGIYWGYIGLIEGIVARIEDEYGEKERASFTVVATGGLAPLFAGGTERIKEVMPHLTLLGLALAHNMNKLS